jgi:hypothetical protein
MFSILTKRKRSTNKPFDRISCDGLEATIWFNQSRNLKPSFRFTLSRILKQNGKPRWVRGFRADDIPGLIHIVHWLADYFAESEHIPMSDKLRAELRMHADLLETMEAYIAEKEEEKRRPGVNGAAGS